jgi:hypothetical protein
MVSSSDLLNACWFKGQNLAGTRRKKWAEKYLSMVRRATLQAPPKLFGRFLEVVRFTEVLAFRVRVALRDAAFVLRLGNVRGIR